MTQDNSANSTARTAKPSLIAQGRSVHGLTRRNLAKIVFDSDNPEQLVRSLPAQSLYLAIKHHGLDSSSDLIEIASHEQCRILLDLDLWKGDRFHEENFWEWLQMGDEDQSFTPVQKLIKSIDLKLVALIISRYVQVEVPDEPQDVPPGPGYYTPDHGRTWLYLKLEDGRQHFLLGRLLAVVFETNAELFYQLLAVPGVSSDSMLEEESYQERQKRLLSEGFPDFEMAASINSPLSEFELKKLVAGSKSGTIFSADLTPIEPLYSDSTSLQPFKRLFEEVKERDSLEEELTLVMNAALIYWNIDLYDQKAAEALLEKVRGAINFGLEYALSIQDLSIDQLFSRIGVRGMYRFGLAKLFDLKNRAKKIPEDRIKSLSDEPVVISIVACLREPFPQLPAYFRSDGTLESLPEQSGKLVPGYRPFETVKDIQALEKFLDSKFS